MQGKYGVFSIQGLNDGIEAEIREGKAIADAAKATGIQHFVYSSVGSAERKTGVPHSEMAVNPIALAENLANCLRLKF